jgi:hypothetical protein
MIDEQSRTPEITVPKCAIRIVQGYVAITVLLLVLFVPIIFLIILTDPEPLEIGFPLLTCIALGVAGISLVFKFVLLGPVSRFLAEPFQKPDTRELTQFKRGAHYSCGVTLHNGCYFGPSFFLWIVFLLERRPIAAVCGGILFLLILVEFPTMSRAKMWGECYFVRPDSLSPVLNKRS